MLPTILAIVGDDRPSAALGGNLLGAPRASARSAVAVRPGGLRFDRDGYSLVVDARTPNRAQARVAFPGLFPPAASAPPDVSATRLTDWIAAWSFLVERDRVWNETLLAGLAAPTSSSTAPAPPEPMRTGVPKFP
jgi:hypothetical protein